MKKNVYIYTYGCQMNVHDSEKMLGLLSDKGYAGTTDPEDADLIIFNTCAIRAKAEQKFFSQLGRTRLLKKKRPDLKIAVAGCVAQEAKEKLLKKAPFVDLVLGPQNIHSLGDLVGRGAGICVDESNDSIAAEDFTVQRQSNIKAWVSIMYGCNNFCSYCIVPYTRGREVSRPSAGILSEVASLADAGYREVTLLGQNVNSYAGDIDFVELLRRIDKLGVPRVRFVTSHPRDFSPELINAVSELPSICEHIHLPIQSGSDRILNLMNRRYKYAEYREKVRLLRSSIPDVSITADIIVGFPGESREDFEQTVEAVGEIEFDGLFAFKYSPRIGTKACSMDDQIEDDVKSERLGRILKLQEDITYRKNRMLEGKELEILIDGVSDTDPGVLAGRTRGNKIVTIPMSNSRAGDFVNVRIEKARLHSLGGSPVE